jgi:hypothetical protein
MKTLSLNNIIGCLFSIHVTLKSKSKKSFNITSPLILRIYFFLPFCIDFEPFSPEYLFDLFTVVEKLGFSFYAMLFEMVSKRLSGLRRQV